MGRIFDELKRRNVFRVAVAYIVASWLLLQVADLVFENIGAPDWVMQAFMFLMLIGFPIVMTFSWVYEITPEGIKREKDVVRDTSITSQTGRKLDIATIGLLIAVVIVVAVERTMFPAVEPATPAPEVDNGIVENSIAVLAFEDLSPEGDQAYFARGLSEELLNVLAQVPDLNVAGRTSSFAMSDTDKSFDEIGAALQVAHILEGSVRKAGNRIRVTAQLIKASTGFHLFSETYDRDLEDIFAVQDEIAAKISDALLSEIIGTEGPAGATPIDSEAYELYLLARQRIHSRDSLPMSEASNMLDRALAIAPDYAPAVTQKALVTYLLSNAMGAYGDTPVSEAVPAAMALVEQALEIDAELADAHAVKGLLLDFLEEYEEAAASLEYALELNPTMSNAANWLGSVYTNLGRKSEIIAIFERILSLDPMYGPAFNNLVTQYMRTSELDMAEALVSRVESIVGENDETWQARGTINVMRGDVAEGMKNLRLSLNENPNSTVDRLWFGYAALNIADFDSVIEVGIPTQVMQARARLGYDDEVLDEIENFDYANAWPVPVLNTFGDIYNRRGMSQQFLDHIVTNFGSVESLLERYPATTSWGVEYLGELAYAYLAVGDTAKFDALMELMVETIEHHRREGTNNFNVDLSEMQYAALAGDSEAAIEAFRNALDGGLRSAGGFDSPLFDGLDGDPRYEVLLAEHSELIDAERAKLGLPPYRPFPVTEEESSDSFVN